jgi:PEP-CTERM motif
MNRPIPLRASMILALLVLVCLSSRAQADSITYDLSALNISGYTGPYGTVTVDRTSSTTATVTFDSLTNGGYEYLFGANSAADVNVNASTWTISSISGTPAFTTGGTLSDGGSGTVDGWGVFNQNVNDKVSFPGSYTEISFTLTDTSGTWANAGSVLTANGKGYYVGAHIITCAGGTSSCTAATDTGYAAGNSPVPEPNSMALLAFGAVCLAGSGLLRRRHSEV